MTLSVTKKEPKIKKWNEGTLSSEKVTWWKKKCQSLFSFSSSPLLRGSTSCRCQVPTLSQTQAHHSMFNVRCDMCNVGWKIHLILLDSQARSVVSLWEHWWYSWLSSLSDGNIIIIDCYHCQMALESRGAWQKSWPCKGERWTQTQTNVHHIILCLEHKYKSDTVWVQNKALNIPWVIFWTPTIYVTHPPR